MFDATIIGGAVTGRPPQISVIVPIGTVDDYLTGQLHAVMAQEIDGTFELVAALNTDTPSDAAIITERIAAIGDARIRCVDASDLRSASHARNVGARAATAPLLAFCDADDIVEPGWLRALMVALGDHAAVGGRVVEFTDSGQPTKWRPPATPEGLPTFLGVPYVISGNMAITRAAFEAVDGFDETLTRCEDIGISWRLLQQGMAPAFAPEAIVRYRVRDSLRSMLHQHYLYGIGMSEVLMRIGRPGDTEDAGLKVLLRPNNQRQGLRSPVALLRKGAIGAGRLVGMLRERRRRRK